ncbi:site-specific recombinase XerD [Shinella sp. DD12]|nr:site-specific recombinase XerD [Shinella sp. DD12]
MRGISISERVLRERARKLGAYRQIGRTIFFTPEDLQKIFEPTASRNSPDTLAEAKAAPAGWRDMPFSKALAAYRDSGKDARFLDKLLLHFQEMKLGDINNVSMSHASQSIYPGRAPATLRRQLYVPVSAIINFVKDNRLRAPKGGGQRTVFMTPDEVEMLIRAAGKQPSAFLAPLITFLVGQGARMGETLSLRGNDVNLSARYAILRDTKNKQERTITLIPRVVAALSLLPTIGNDGPVFRRFDGKEFKERKSRGGQIRNPFSYAVEQAGLSDEVTPHICRHTWATWHYAVNKDPLLLKKEGGWLSNEYQRYVKSAPCGLAESIVYHGWGFSTL